MVMYLRFVDFGIDIALHLYYNSNEISTKGVLLMAKTIQVRVNDELKDSADVLFTSLGLDTSTAVRMFLVASTESGGIPFAVGRGVDRDAAIMDAITYRRTGGKFLTAEQSLANMRTAMKAGAGVVS